MLCGCSMDNPYTIYATIGETQVIEASLNGPNNIEAEVTIPRVIVEPYDQYDGPYSLVPRFYEQKLETKNKTLIDDVTVEVIPAHEVTNPAGGLTVTIG